MEFLDAELPIDKVEPISLPCRERWQLGDVAAMRRASSSEIFLVRQGTGESVMTFWLVASA